MTRWVKLSLNFEFLVPKEGNEFYVNAFLITFFVQLELFRIQETTKKKLNKRGRKKFN